MTPVSHLDRGACYVVACGPTAATPDGKQIKLVGEVNDTDKGDLLRSALALVFPIDWPEHFGLVMIEAMACATPVVAYRRGSVPEVIDDWCSPYCEHRFI